MTRTCLGDKPAIQDENSLPEYLVNVDAPGKSEDLLSFYKVQKNRISKKKTATNKFTSKENIQ